MRKLKKLFLILTLSSGLTTSAQTIPNYVPTAGLVGWWPFSGNANDLSGYGNNGTVFGPTLTSDRFGANNSAYKFNLNYIKVNNNTLFDFTNTMTINAWYKVSGNANSGSLNMYIVAKHLAGTTQSSYCLYNNNNCGPTVYMTDMSSLIYYLRNSTFCDTLNWHMLTMSLDNTNLKMYLDGNTFSVTTAPLSIKQTTLPLVFGGANNSSSLNDILPTMLGNIDDIGLWNRALTDCEVKKLYNSGSGLTVKSSSATICRGESVVLAASGATNYLWSNGATTSSIALTPSISTVYTVNTTYTLGCNDLRTINVTVNACTGINKYEDSQYLQIFPNPAKTEINVTTSINYSSIVILNAIGEEIVKKEKSNLLSIEDLSDGVYYIKLLDKENKVLASNKFIKE
jgi:hypothetical protein